MKNEERLELIVHIYESRIRIRAEDELKWFRDQPNVKSAVEYAASAINSKGKRYSHQRRIKRAVLNEGKRVHLANLQLIEAAKDFDDLYALIRHAIKRIKGLGDLYVYDTAFRIGAYAKKLPKKVYLHAGTRKGADALGFDGSRPTLELSEFDPALRVLKAYEIEDVLCIFKDDLKKIRPTLQGNQVPYHSWCD